MYMRKHRDQIKAQRSGLPREPAQAATVRSGNHSMPPQSSPGQWSLAMVRMVMTAVMKTGIYAQVLHHCLSGHMLRDSDTWQACL